MSFWNRYSCFHRNQKYYVALNGTTSRIAASIGHDMLKERQRVSTRRAPGPMMGRRRRIEVTGVSKVKNGAHDIFLPPLEWKLII